MGLTSRTLVPLLLLQLTTARAQQAQFPTLQEFNNVLTVCAAGSSLSLTGSIKGNFESVYKEKFVSSPGVKVVTAADFLNSLPDTDKLAGFQVYQTCVVGILTGKITTASPKPAEANDVELPARLETFGKPLQIKAGVLTARSEIRAFPLTSFGSAGVSGVDGANGANGGAGSGGKGGDGMRGTEGAPGNAGLAAGEISLEADSFVGNLRIVNIGQDGGAGGSGGSGGNGGAGGRGTDSVNGMFDCHAGPGNGGQGGNAGGGGDGGKGGNGGNGGAVIVRFKTVSPGSTISIVSNGGNGGKAGEPGQRGAIGHGGPMGNTGGHCGAGGRGPGANGVEASNGRKLGDGNEGRSGQIEITIGDQTFSATGELTKNF